MSRGARLLQILIRHCDEYTALISQETDEPLALLDRLALRIHVLSCRPCRRFRQQMTLLRAAIQRVLTRAEDADAALPAETRLRILNALRDQAPG